MYRDRAATCIERFQEEVTELKAQKLVVDKHFWVYSGWWVVVFVLLYFEAVLLTVTNRRECWSVTAHSTSQLSNLVCLLLPEVGTQVLDCHSTWSVRWQYLKLAYQVCLHLCASVLKTGSQYDAGTNVAIQASRRSWSWLKFNPSAVSPVLASVQQIRMSKTLTWE